MGGNSTGIAVGCAVGIPCFIAFCVAFVFFLKTRRRFKEEDLEFSRHHDVDEMNKDLSYNNFEQLKMEQDNTNSEPSEDSDQSGHHNQDSGIDDSEKKSTQTSTNESKKQRYVPAYRKKFKSSITNLNNSRNSSFSNLQNGGSAVQGSNSSINSNTTNQTDYFYNNIPIMQDQSGTKQADSSNNSLDLARSLQVPTPSYSKKPAFTKSSSVSTNDDEDDYDLKNNYRLENEHEIQEEDQYENEFTNYSENKRAYINSLRPK